MWRDIQDSRLRSIARVHASRGQPIPLDLAAEMLRRGLTPPTY